MNIVIEWPQLIYVVLTFLSIAIVASQHGKLIKRNAFAALIDVVIVYSLLYWGGFFS
jgi:hypothetical protein